MYMGSWFNTSALMLNSLSVGFLEIKAKELAQYNYIKKEYISNSNLYF